jgi:hypothetical protein
MLIIPGLKIMTTFDWLKPRVLTTHIPGCCYAILPDLTSHLTNQMVLFFTITGINSLSTFLSVDMEILTPFSSLYTLRLRLRMYFTYRPF